MKASQASSGTSRYLLRDLLILSGVVVLALVAARFTPAFEILFSGMDAFWGPGAVVGVLASVAAAAVLLLAARGSGRRGVSPDAVRPLSFPDFNPNPVVEVDADGTVRYQNPSAAALFPEMGRDGAAHPFLADLPSMTARLREGPSRPLVREVRVGTSVYEQHLLCVPGTDHVHVYGVDITRRKHAAEARQQSEKKFARVFRSAPIAIGISRLSDGRFLDVNDSLVRLLGYDERRDIVGRTALETGMWVEGADRGRVLQLLSENEAKVHTLEAQVRRRDGAARDVILSFELMEFDGEACVLSTMLDVTERNQAEAGIAVLKAFYENTLKELPIQVTVFDSEARFFYMNPATIRDDDLRLWLVGKTSVDYARAQGLDPAPYRRRHEWLLGVVERKEIDQLEEVLTTPNGEQRYLLSVATPVLDEADDVLYVVGYGLDITDRKLFEQRLTEAKNAAEEMARLKSAFVANMSHEVRTPLTAIMGFATVLGEEIDEDKRELVEIIRQSGERLLETLNSVLDLARLESNALEVDPKPLDLEDELLAAARIYKPMAQKKGLVFKMETPRREMRAQLDRACLHRVLSNLLSNAIKFTEEGEIRLLLRPAGSEVQIEVQDTGIGIDQAFLPHLFEEFKQESTGLARTHTGSGLGLAITRHLVERMHGRIEVQSDKGAGTTFTVTFPAMISKPVCLPYPAVLPEEQTWHQDAQTVES